MADQIERIMTLGESDRWRYMGLSPAIPEEELTMLPPPESSFGVNFYPNVQFYEYFPDGSVDIGVMVSGDSQSEINQVYVEHARKVAEHIGNVSLHDTVRSVGPGSSVTGQILHGVRPQY